MDDQREADVSGNELLPGEPRLGWLIDGNPDTEHVAVMLRDTGAAIDLAVPLKGMFSADDSYGRWWSHGVHFGDDPDRSRHSYEPPRTLKMQDAAGSVVLVGCRSSRSTHSFSVGQGHVVANFAVLGASHLRYEKVDGLRTEVPALAAWTRLSTMKVQTEANAQNRVQSVRMELTSAEPIKLARPLNLIMRSEWRTERPRGGFSAYEGVELGTSVGRPRSWNDHLKVHGGVLELVSVAAWRPFGIASIKVQRRDDPGRTMSGAAAGDRWLRVVTHRLPRHEPWERDPHFLYPYKEIGSRGVSRWFRIRELYARVVNPLLTILRSDSPWGSASVVQSGIALEALGYLVDVHKNNGAHLNSRSQMNFKPGLRVLLADMKAYPVSDLDGWIERADAAYMAAKHPDRAELDSLESINALRENILMLRFWIGQTLGVKPKSLLAALESDPLAHPFVPVS